MVAYGVFLQRDRKNDEAESWFHKASAAGHPAGMANIGILLAERDNVEEAETWLRRAATAGGFVGMAELAKLLYERGELTEAETWYRRAAETGRDARPPEFLVHLTGDVISGWHFAAQFVTTIAPRRHPLSGGSVWLGWRLCGQR